MSIQRSQSSAGRSHYLIPTDQTHFLRSPLLPSTETRNFHGHTLQTEHHECKRLLCSTLRGEEQSQRGHTWRKLEAASRQLPSKDAAPAMPLDPPPYSLNAQPTRFCPVAFLGRRILHRNECTLLLSFSAPPGLRQKKGRGRR